MVKYEKYVIVPSSLLDDENLSPIEMKLMINLIRFDGAFGSKNKEYSFNNGWLMKKSGIKSDSTFKGAIKNLKKNGYLANEKKDGHYIINWDKLEDKRKEEVEELDDVQEEEVSEPVQVQQVEVRKMPVKAEKENPVERVYQMVMQKIPSHIFNVTFKDLPESKVKEVMVSQIQAKGKKDFDRWKKDDLVHIDLNNLQQTTWINQLWGFL